ncbi:MAG: hypothetical protein ACK4M3_03720 [Pyrobaculum sp.]
MASIALLLVSLAVLAAVSPLYFKKQVEAPPVSISPYVYGEDAGATLYNLAIFFILLTTATVLVYVLFSRRKALHLFLYFAWFVLSTGVLQFYAVIYYWSGLLSEERAVWLIWASLPLGGLVVYLIYKKTGDHLLGFLGSLAGGMFVWLLPEMTIVALLVMLPLYDYLMVAHGLLGKLVKKTKEATAQKGGKGETPLLGFVVRLNDMSLGVGDFVIYSMALTLIAMNFIKLGVFISLASIAIGIACIYVGLRLTVEIFLKRWGYGPALPFPILMLSPLIVAAWLI